MRKSILYFILFPILMLIATPKEFLNYIFNKEKSTVVIELESENESEEECKSIEFEIDLWLSNQIELYHNPSLLKISKQYFTLLISKKKVIYRPIFSPPPNV